MGLDKKDLVGGVNDSDLGVSVQDSISLNSQNDSAVIKKSKKLIVANWKMNGSARKIVSDLQNYVSDIATNSENIVLALPATYLALAKAELKKYSTSKINLAAQDVSKFLCSGAYTGEISAEMLKDVGAHYVIVGHSERRMFFHETNHALAKKLDMVIANGMIPIFCIGEDKSARERHKHFEVLTEQLQLLHLIEEPVKELIIAYEPTWCIGTGDVPTTFEIGEVMDLVYGFVQNYLPHAKITTLYGGSVTSSNIKNLLSIDNNEGVLVGGASLDVDEFKKICREA